MTPTPERDGSVGPSRLVPPIARSGIVTDLVTGIKTRYASDTTSRAGELGSRRAGTGQCGEPQQAHFAGLMALVELTHHPMRRDVPSAMSVVSASSGKRDLAQDFRCPFPSAALLGSAGGLRPAARPGPSSDRLLEAAGEHPNRQHDVAEAHCLSAQAPSDCQPACWLLWCRRTVIRFSAGVESSQ
jgi:hypothetical protein